MYRYVGKSLFFALVLTNILGCAAVEPQRKENAQSTPKVTEEDIFDNKSGGYHGQSTENVNPYSSPGTVQPGNTAPLPHTDSVPGRSPRRFIWKDKN
jgi:hypothetical protein